MEKLTQARLKELLDYNEYTGIFKWIVRRKGSKGVGGVAGSLEQGYIRLSVDYKRHFAHRLAWLYMYGYMPENFIDHINRDPSDNRIVNLREVSHQCNLRNTGNPITNTSSVKGVCWCKQNSKWRSYIRNGKNPSALGHYKSLDNAVCARLAAEQCLNWSGCDSSSPAFKYVQNMIN